MPTIGADSVEDDSTGATHAALRVREQIERMRLLAAIELIVAAQAVDLALGGRAESWAPDGRPMPRSVSGSPLVEDRPMGPDVERLTAELLVDGQLLERVARPWASLVSAIELTYLGGADVDALALTDRRRHGQAG